MTNASVALCIPSIAGIVVFYQQSAGDTQWVIGDGRQPRNGRRDIICSRSPQRSSTRLHGEIAHFCTAPHPSHCVRLAHNSRSDRSVIGLI